MSAAERAIALGFSMDVETRGPFAQAAIAFPHPQEDHSVSTIEASSPGSIADCRGNPPRVRAVLYDASCT